MSDPPLKDCPKCGKEVRRLIFGGAGVIFKGSGFYVTDKGKTGKNEKKPAASAQKSESVSSGGSEKGDSALKTVPAASAAGTPVHAESSKPESKSA